LLGASRSLVKLTAPAVNAWSHSNGLQGVKRSELDNVDLKIMTDLRTLTGVWVGDIGLGQALRDHRIRLDGSTRLKRDIATWLGKNYFADVSPAR
jgi:hypothetical protein